MNEYLELKIRLDELSMPYFLIPGNHDDRAALRQAFPDLASMHNETKFIQFVVEEYPLRLIFLDTLDPGRDSGRLDHDRLAWLQHQLAAAPHTPTVIFMHHPPFDTGIRRMDEINCVGSNELAKVVSGFSCVDRIFCGHVHRLIQTQWAGILACAAPSCAHQMELDLRNQGTLAFNLEPPAFLLHLWLPDSGIVTHLCMIDTFPGPYRYN
jgi:3',5'-cyclic AMP phosphodiesterase CpdA